MTLRLRVPIPSVSPIRTSVCANNAELWSPSPSPCVAFRYFEQCKVVLRGIRHKVLDQVKRKKSSFPEDDMHQRIKEVIYILFLRVVRWTGRPVQPCSGCI